MSETLEKAKDAKRRLREHDARRKVIEAELLAIQHACEHPNAKTWSAMDYGGFSTQYFECPDCLKATST